MVSQGVEKVQARIMDKAAPEFGLAIFNVLMHCVEQGQAPLIAQVLTVLTPLRLQDHNQIKELDSRVKDLIHNRDLNVNDLTVTSSVLQKIMSDMYQQTQDIEYKEYLIKIISEERKQFGPQLKSMAIRHLMLTFDEYHEKQAELIRDMTDEVGELVQNCNLADYMNLLNIFKNSHAAKNDSQKQTPVLVLEKKFYDICSDITQTREIVEIVEAFAAFGHQSDGIWDVLTKCVINIVPGLTGNELAKIVYSYGQIKRGSNKFWDYLAKFISHKSSDMTQDHKVTCLLGMEQSQFKSKELNQVLLDEVFKLESINSIIDSQNDMALIKLAEQSQIKADIKPSDLHMVENAINDSWENLNPMIQYEIMDAYQLTGKKSDLLQQKFEFLVQTYQKQEDQ